MPQKKCHKILLSLVLLATLLKYYKHKININVENLIANNLIQKKLSSIKDEGRKMNIP